MRLVDIDALSHEMYHLAFETDSNMQKWDGGCWIRYKMFEKCRDNAPTIDAVPVVRCKDCINRPYKIRQDKESNGFNLNARESGVFPYYCPFMCEDGWYSIIPPDDFYCKNWERRTDANS